jgi:hypothetical protein
MRIYSASDLGPLSPAGVSGLREAHPDGVTKDAWNGWRLEDWGPDGWHIVHLGYVVDLDRFRSSSVALDCIMQVAKKSWATDACTAGLVRALNDILQPQANLCSCGANKTMTAAQIAARAVLLARFVASQQDTQDKAVQFSVFECP